MSSFDYTKMKHREMQYNNSNNDVNTMTINTSSNNTRMTNEFSYLEFGISDNSPISSTSQRLDSNTNSSTSSTSGGSVNDNTSTMSSTKSLLTATGATSTSNSSSTSNTTITSSEASTSANTSNAAHTPKLCIDTNLPVLAYSGASTGTSVNTKDPEMVELPLNPSIEYRFVSDENGSTCRIVKALTTTIFVTSQEKPSIFPDAVSSFQFNAPVSPHQTVHTVTSNMDHHHNHNITSGSSEFGMHKASVAHQTFPEFDFYLT